MKRIIAFVSLLFTGLLYIPCFAQTRLAGDYGFSWGDDDNYRYYRRRIGDSVWIDTRGSFNKVIDIPGGTTGAFSVNWQELRYVYLTTDSLFTPVCIESSNPDVISVEVISDSTVVKDYFGKAWHATVYALSFKTEGSAVISMVDKRGYSAEDKWYVAVYESTGIELEYVGNTSIGIGETLKMNAVRGITTLFHCTAGKDRTGIASMALLKSYGVGNEVIIRDYMRTNRNAFLPTIK